MKIIYLHQYFKTPAEGGAIRSYYLARALVQAGHQVEMITSHNQQTYKQQQIDGISVHYLPVFYANQLGFWQRIRAFVVFFWKAYQKAKKIQHAEICYATSTPLSIGLLAWLLKKTTGLKYIFEVRDLWPQAPVALGIIKNKWLIRVLYQVEKKIYQNAETIIALSPGIRESIQTKAPDKKVILIPNLADTVFFQPKIRSDDREKFTILYTGTLGTANHLEHLLDLAHYAMAQSENRLCFKIMGEGKMRDTLLHKAQKLALNNLEFLEAGNKEAVREALYQAQAVYVSFADVPVLQTNSPNKFFDALAAAKLVIVNVRGWLKDLVEAHQCGFYASNENQESNLRQLREFIESSEKLEKYQQNARKLALEKFSLEKNIPTVLALFGDAAAAH